MKLQYIAIYNLQVFFLILLLYFRDTVIYLIHIDLMRKCCQLINVDVDVDANESSRQLFEDGITTRRWLVDSPGGGGVLPYMGYMGMCRCEGYGFQAVYSRIGYINQNIWVSENRETARLG